MFGKNEVARSQILVQITGAIRNLSNDDESYSRMIKNKVVPKLTTCMEKYNLVKSKD